VPDMPLPPIGMEAPYTALAMGLFLLSSQPGSNITCAPMTREFPSARLLRCTKRSALPSAGAMKPIPLSSIQAFTTPGCPFTLAGGGKAADLEGPPWSRLIAPVHFAAMGLFFESSQPGSKKTSAPTTRALPSIRLLRWTKTSGPPSAGEMKPIPLSSIQALTVPGWLGLSSPAMEQRRPSKPQRLLLL